MEESEKAKILEDKLLASMKTEIALLKKLKHLALQRSDKEGAGCKAQQHPSAWSPLQSSASETIMMPGLNGHGTNVERRNKRTGPVYQSSLGVQPCSSSPTGIARCASVEVLVTDKKQGAANGSAGLSRPSSSHSNYTSEPSPTIFISEAECDEDSPSDDNLRKNFKLTQWNSIDSRLDNLKIPSTNGHVHEGYFLLEQNGHTLKGRSLSVDRDIGNLTYSVQSVKESTIVRRSSLPSASKVPTHPKQKKKVEKQRQEEIDDSIANHFSTFEGLLATKTEHWLEKYLRQDWRSMCSDCSELTEAEEARRDKVWEVLCSEVKYFISQLQPLRIVYKNFLVFLQSQDPPVLSGVDTDVVFGNVNEVYELSVTVAIDILKLFQFKPANEVAMSGDLVAVFRMFGAKFNPVYQRYAMNYERTSPYRHKLLSQPGYKKYQELCQSQRLCHRLRLEDLLISPVKHLGHYPLLLKEIIKHTHDAQGQSLLHSTLKAFSVALKELECRISHYKERLHLEDLHSTIHWPTVADMDPDTYVPQKLQFKLSEQPCQQLLVMDGRACLHEGSLKLIGSRGQTVKKLQAILLTDCLLLTEHKKLNARTKSSVVYKEPISLQHLEVYDVGEDGYPRAFCCVVSNLFKQHTALYTLQADSRESKEVWLERLKTAQQEMSLHN